MQKVTGIKSVDFRIYAYGHGVVNWNGSTELKTLIDGSWKTVTNHNMPKLRGYTNKKLVSNDKGEKFETLKEAAEVNFDDTPLYISQNCIRHHLFREQAFDLHFAGEKSLDKVLASITGLIRGYVVPSSQCKRTSPLLLEDFVDQLGNGNFEQFGQAGERDSSSFFSKTTFGDTEYISYGSISIEQLQFISLDNKFDRCAMIIKDNQGEAVAKQVQDFIQSLDPSRSPKATFHANYVRLGTIYEQGEAGILLDDTAIDILVKTTLGMIQELVIRQAKGYMYVDRVEVDYNDSNKMMRIKRHGETNPTATTNYAIYFEAK